MFPRILFLNAAFLIFFGSVSPIGAGGNDLADLNIKTPRYLVNQGKKLFVHYCAHCHGLSGDGDGFNAEYLEKEPAELSHETFQSKKNQPSNATCGLPRLHFE